jgi:hypothetical protein
MLDSLLDMTEKIGRKSSSSFVVLVLFSLENQEKEHADKRTAGYCGRCNDDGG